MSGPFELLRFEATPVAPAVAVVELDGTFAGLEPTRPRLLVEAGGVEREMPALAAGGSPWSATFAVPLAALGDPDAVFSLIPGRGPVIALPTPSDTGGDDDDRFVRLARTANDLRHRLGEATERAAGAAERLVEAGEERDRLMSELGKVRDQLAAAETRASEAHDAALTAREEQARAEGEADVERSEAERSVADARAEAERSVAEARAEAEREVAEARAAVAEELERTTAELETARAQLTELQDRVVAAEDEARAARRDLRDARARVESLVRENRTARIAAARARVPSATPGDFRAARLGPGWAAHEDEDEDATTPMEAGGGGGEETVAFDASGAPLRADDAEEGSADPDDSAGHDFLHGEPSGEDEAAGSAASPGDEVLDHDRSESDQAPSAESAPSPGDDTGDDDPSAEGEPFARAADSAAGSGDDPTESLAAPAAGDAPTTASLEPVESGSPVLWSDENGESVRILRPRTPAGRLRPAPALSEDDDQDTGDDVLDPAAVGARAIQPAESSPRHRALELASNPRVIVGGIFALLLLALILIFNGVGPV